MLNISKEVKAVRVMNAVAAGFGDTLNGSVLDMANFDGVVFIAAFGAITATAVTSVKAQQGAASNLSDAADLAGSKIDIADSQSNKLAVLDIYRPQKRYLRMVVSRATQNAVIDGVVALQYKGKKAPVTQDASVAGDKLCVSPDEGVA